MKFLTKLTIGLAALVLTSCAPAGYSYEFEIAPMMPTVIYRGCYLDYYYCNYSMMYDCNLFYGYCGYYMPYNYYYGTPPRQYAYPRYVPPPRVAETPRYRPPVTPTAPRYRPRTPTTPRYRPMPPKTNTPPPQRPTHVGRHAQPRPQAQPAPRPRAQPAPRPKTSSPRRREAPTK